MVYSKTSVVDLSTNLGEMVINTFLHEMKVKYLIIRIIKYNT